MTRFGVDDEGRERPLCDDPLDITGTLARCDRFLGHPEEEHHAVMRYQDSSTLVITWKRVSG